MHLNFLFWDVNIRGGTQNALMLAKELYSRDHEVTITSLTRSSMGIVLQGFDFKELSKLKKIFVRNL